MIVLTHNEAVNIAACVQSLDRFDEVVVVDSGSTDGTLDILRERFPGVRVLHNAFEDFGQQRNWALDHAQARNRWVLFLDADERCTPACASAIDRAVAGSPDHDGYFLCYRNMFLGTWIKRSTLYPSWQLRLLRVGRVRYRKEGHGQREVMDGSAGYLDAPYDHYGFSKGIADWVARHNAYSSNEVELVQRLAGERIALSDMLATDPVQRRRALKQIASRLPLRPVARFAYLYFFRRGFLDGRAGLIFCLLRAAHEIHIVAKLAEAEALKATDTPRSRVAASGAASGRPIASRSSFIP